ncbi:zinc-binding alcohol dehydrogenase [Solwaraspora sp. WMMD791]|uniref:L-erythro-3,5-diaminohexanoate dehydrogenase n=1 Tax=Solwaraspora sp. WMMD791 TaxID=3016086 RepID=UPI00249BCF5C|nr:zinc-binding alcohol dehydrogenase [Solwaraspora sp. WMMD791]WFE30477.1 zinc-binding alcohol dehydrogenase [Solwaraspora sp. WMMD791]
MSPVGLHRVREPVGALPQAAWRLDTDPRIADDEIRIRVERLNLDAASFRQLREAHGGDGAAVRAEVAGIIARRGKMHNPVTGSGGMLIGTVDAVGSRSTAGVRVGQRVASLVSLTLTPLVVTDGLAGWDGTGEQVPCTGHAILFGRTVVAPLPADLPDRLALAVFDVCGAPALTDRVVRRQVPADPRAGLSVAVLGAAGKSGCLAVAAARRAGAARTVGVVPTRAEHDRLAATGLASAVVVADARDPVAVSAAVREVLGGGADVTVVCVDVPGCEHGAVLSTADGGTVVFFSMATSFAAAALGAEGLAADVTMLVGNGFVPGHAEFAVGLLRAEPGVRALFEARLTAD